MKVEATECQERKVEVEDKEDGGGWSSHPRKPRGKSGLSHSRTLAHSRCTEETYRKHISTAHT